MTVFPTYASLLPHKKTKADASTPPESNATISSHEYGRMQLSLEVPCRSSLAVADVALDNAER